MWVASWVNIGTEMIVNSDTSLISATDCSFIPESGSHTYGLAKFYNGARSEAGKGLEISEPAVTDVNYDTAYSVSTRQTPDTLPAGQTRTDRYVGHSVQDAPCLPPSVRYPAADGYYAESESADGVTGAGYHLISELRHDANLRRLYAGAQKPEGRSEMYDGKVRSDNTDRSESIGGTDNVSLHTAVVNSPSPKRSIRIVYPVSRQGGKVAAALLFSADIHLPAADIRRFCKARFQTECSVPGCEAVCRTSGLSVPL